MEARDTDRMLESWLVRVSGRVQGIGYREACVGRARELGVTGWVRNRMDESVEAMLQGSPEQQSTLQHYLADTQVRQAAWRSRLAHPAWQAQPNRGHLALVDWSIAASCKR